MFNTREEYQLYKFVSHLIKRGDIETAKKAWNTNRKENYNTFDEILKDIEEKA